MQIAYIVLAHKHLEQLARLIGALNDEGVSFLVHLDRHADRAVGGDAWRELQGLIRPDVRLIPVPRQRCYWGSFSLVAATLAGIRALREANVPFDRAVLISGQDYPIKSRSRIREFLAAHPQQEFMESFAFATPNRWSDYGGPYQAMARATHWHLQLRGRWLHTRLRRRLPLGMQPHGGSQWWCLTRACVEYIDEFCAAHPEVVRYFHHAFIPDEMFFQCIVANSRFAAHLAADNLTFVDSSSPTPPWPTTLDRHWFQRLMQSPKLYARKFDVKLDATILDMLDEAIAEAPQAGGRAPSVRARLR